MIENIEVKGRWCRVNTETGERIELTPDNVCYTAKPKLPESIKKRTRK